MRPGEIGKHRDQRKANGWHRVGEFARFSGGGRPGGCMAALILPSRAGRGAAE